MRKALTTVQWCLQWSRWKTLSPNNKQKIPSSSAKKLPPTVSRLHQKRKQCIEVDAAFAAAPHLPRKKKRSTKPGSGEGTASRPVDRPQASLTSPRNGRNRSLAYVKKKKSTSTHTVRCWPETTACADNAPVPLFLRPLCCCCCVLSYALFSAFQLLAQRGWPRRRRRWWSWFFSVRLKRDGPTSHTKPLLDWFCNNGAAERHPHERNTCMNLQMLEQMLWPLMMMNKFLPFAEGMFWWLCARDNVIIDMVKTTTALGIRFLWIPLGGFGNHKATTNSWRNLVEMPKNFKHLAPFIVRI